MKKKIKKGVEKKEFYFNWPMIIIGAIVIGIYTAVMAMLPIARDTSFSDLTVTFEVWILFGILIIMNSKSNLDSALKCFVFFLISQPLVYIVQDLVNHTQLFNTYYRFWIMWTVACLPMGYIGYYMKKDKWWGLLILIPIMLLLTMELSKYFSETMFSFPNHILTTIFCIATLIIYPLYIFKNKKIRITGLVIDIVLVVAVITMSLVKPYVYSTTITCNSEKLPFNDKYKVYLEDKKYGELNIVTEGSGKDKYYCIHADFKRKGKTKLIIESPKGEKRVFKIDIMRTDKYDYEEIKK